MATTNRFIDISSSDITLWSTAVVFAFLSLAVYRWILFPILTSRRQPQGTRNNATGTTATAAATGASPSQTASSSSRSNHESEQSEILTLLAQNATFPSHVGTSTVASMLSTNAMSSPSSPAVSSHQLLSNGLVAFRYTQAAVYEPTSAAAASQVEMNRRDRARILSRMLSLEQPAVTAPTVPPSSQSQQQQRRNQHQQQQQQPTSSSSSSSSSSRLTPPLRGGTLVVSVPEEDVDCNKLRRILYLLGTFYNLLVVVVVEPTSNTDPCTLQGLNKLVHRVRGTDPTLLPPEVLPSHRIVAASSVVGRVALVRQLARVELVLECDTQVQVQLQRFGFKVLVYGQAPTPELELQGGANKVNEEHHHLASNIRQRSAGESLLGSLLLP